MAIPSLELRTILIERGLSEEAADRITSLAERSFAEEREYVNGEFARRDREAEGRGSRLDRIEDLLRQISEREAQAAERLAKLEEELVQVRLEQERFRSELARVETEARADRERIETEARADRERIETEARAERTRIETDARAHRERIEAKIEAEAQSARDQRESLANQLRADFHRELLIVTGIVVGVVAVAAGVIIAVLS